MQGFGNAQQGLIATVQPPFAGNVPEHDHLTCGIAGFIIEQGPVEDDIEQSTVLGQPTGFKILQFLFLEKLFYTAPCFRLEIVRYKGDTFTLEFGQGPAKYLLKRWVQVRHGAVHIENKHGHRQEVQKVSIFQFRSAAGPILLFGTLPGFFQFLLGAVLIGDVPGNPPEPGPATGRIYDQAGGNCEDTRLAIFAANLPDDIRTLDTGFEDRIEVGECRGGMVRVHELSVVSSLDLLGWITENPAKGIIKKDEITLDVGFIETIPYILDEHPIAFQGNHAVCSSGSGQSGIDLAFSGHVRSIFSIISHANSLRLSSGRQGPLRMPHDTRLRGCYPAAPGNGKLISASI